MTNEVAKIFSEEMDPQIAEWLAQLFRKEREDVEGAADNEHIWAEGSANTQQACMHFNNEELLREYAELLEKLEKEVAKNA